MDYEITFDTQVILPVENNSSRIIENNESYVINVPPMQVLEHSCEYFGSSYEGRKEGTKNYYYFDTKCESFDKLIEMFKHARTIAREAN